MPPILLISLTGYRKLNLNIGVNIMDRSSKPSKRRFHILYSLLLVPLILYLPTFVSGDYGAILFFYIGIPIMSLSLLAKSALETSTCYILFFSYFVLIFVLFKLNIENKIIYCVCYIYSIIQSLFAWLLLLGR